MSRVNIRVLETSFRGYPRKEPCTWALHYNIAFACEATWVPEFLAEYISDVRGYFQLPQHFCEAGIWGQFERVDVRLENDIGLGPLRVWRTHGRATVTRNHIWDVWARVKIVYSFRRFDEPVWFKHDVAFRCPFRTDLKKRCGDDYAHMEVKPTTLCFVGRRPSYSIETSMTGRADWSLAGLTCRFRDGHS